MLIDDPATTGANGAEDLDEATDAPRASRDKFRRERDAGAGDPDALEVDEFGRTVDNRKRRERSKSPSPVSGGGAGPTGGKSDASRGVLCGNESASWILMCLITEAAVALLAVPTILLTTVQVATIMTVAKETGTLEVNFIGLRIALLKNSFTYSRNQDPMDLDYLLTRDSFADLAKEQARKKGTRNMSSEEMDRRYEIYRENYTHKALQKYFSSQKDNEWFREKYHPEDSKALKAEVSRRRADLLAKFADELKAGVHDAILYDAPVVETVKEKEAVSADVPAEVSGLELDQPKEDAAGDELPAEEVESEVKEEEVKEEEATSMDITEPTKPTGLALCIKAIHPRFLRKDLTELCSSVDGFKYLVLGEPNPARDSFRVGWVVFNEGTDMDAAFQSLEGRQLEGFQFHVMRHSKEDRTRQTAAEFSTPERLRHDLAQIKKLAATLDEENGFEAGSSGAHLVEQHLKELLSTDSMDTDEQEDGEKALSQVKKSLDMYILYLRSVHTYDYYGTFETSSPESLDRKAYLHLRRPAQEKKNSIATQRLDNRVDLRIRKPLDGPEVTKLGGLLLEVELEKALHKHVKKEAEGKYRCIECQKLFKGEEFVKKHIRSKHNELTLPTRKHVEYFNNFVRDPNRTDVTRPPATPMHGLPSRPLANGTNMPIMVAHGMVGGVPVITPLMMQNMGVNMQYMSGPNSGRGGRGTDQYRSGGPPRNRGPMQSRLGPPPPPSGRRDSQSDPRSIRAYDDLDNPVPSGEMEISYD
ncbi:hypothetical protein HKX48_007656 [Thoreauomyces humboldtii]|nr:hypothetical protein HKX48_007656 [Thoreauomyces humboldtii]